jgi:hypothetical protein
MTYQEQSESKIKLKSIITDFVNNEIKDRFIEFVSNAFLIELLFIELAYSDLYSSPNTNFKIQHFSYNAAVQIFENILEHRLGVKINGHSLSQQFSDYVSKNIE